MPRGPRLDIPGLLQHVIVRGVDRRDIFLDDEDRDGFVRRLSALLEETETTLLAWAVLSNHFHLLVRPQRSTLALFMRRLLTGYAVTFNLRHRRSGHLFQNRYKSIVCDEEPYLLELVRYIHLNPLRSGMVSSMEELDRSAWSGHAMLMGMRKLSGQDVEGVLAPFGKNVREARKQYRAFIEAGVGQGRRNELVGGGLQRSMVARGAETTQEREAFDQRVLGTGEFVERLWHKEELRDRISRPITLEKLLGRVADAYSIRGEELKWRSRARPISDARAVACYLAVREAGYKGVQVAAILGLTSAGVSLAVRRGAEIVSDDPSLRKALAP